MITAQEFQPPETGGIIASPMIGECFEAEDRGEEVEIRERMYLPSQILYFKQRLDTNWYLLPWTVRLRKGRLDFNILKLNYFELRTLYTYVSIIGPKFNYIV